MFVQIQRKTRFFNLEAIADLNEVNDVEIRGSYFKLGWNNNIQTYEQEQRRTQIDKIQVSFQNTFFNQHEELLREKMNHFNRIFNIQDRCSFNLQQKKQINKNNFICQNINKNKIKSKWEIDQFTKGIETDYKINEFMFILSKMFADSVGDALQTAVFLSWLEYQKVRKFDKFDIRAEDLQKIGEELSTGELRNLIVNSIPMFSVSNVNQTQLQQINEFLTFFITTVLFITEEFFQNPFYVKKELRKDEELSQCSEEQWFQDEQDDDDSDIFKGKGLLGRKMTKLDI